MHAPKNISKKKFAPTKTVKKYFPPKKLEIIFFCQQKFCAQKIDWSTLTRLTVTPKSQAQEGELIRRRLVR